MIIDIADLDTIFLTYDEPQKEEFWVKLKAMIPWAKRVDGVKGSDAAHKAAANASDTERFILIDGDNIPDAEFFGLSFDFRNLPETYKNAQFRYKAKNHINGLCYGNGGVSSWTKTYVQNMRTHENSEGDDKHTVDFCMDSSDSLYWSMNDCYSTTYPNHTPFQAFRAGFREGVKMCLVNGTKPQIPEINDMVASRNINNLTVWHNVGIDVDNGIWAMYGARLGTYTTLLTDYDPKDVQWFDNFDALWDKHKHVDVTVEMMALGDILSTKLGFPMINYNAEQSAFFKRHQPQHRNFGTLIKEMDIIRKMEGW
jgi:hypothetical protein